MRRVRRESERVRRVRDELWDATVAEELGERGDGDAGEDEGGGVGDVAAVSTVHARGVKVGRRRWARGELHAVGGRDGEDGCERAAEVRVRRERGGIRDESHARRAARRALRVGVPRARVHTHTDHVRRALQSAEIFHARPFDARV